jgi:hypothetical protein
MILPLHMGHPKRTTVHLMVAGKKQKNAIRMILQAVDF